MSLHCIGCIYLTMLWRAGGESVKRSACDLRSLRIGSEEATKAMMITAQFTGIPRWISFGRNSKERHENNHRQDECEGDPCSSREIDPDRDREHASENRRCVASPTNSPGILFVIGTSPPFCDEFFLEVFSFYFYERTNPRGEWQKPR